MARVLPGAPRLAADCLVGSGLEAMAVGVSWMVAPPAARHGQQRRGYSGRTSERSHHVGVGRVIFEVQGDKKLGLRRSRLFSKRRRRSTLFKYSVSIAGNRFGKIARKLMVYWPQEDSLQRNILIGADNP